MFKKNGGKSKLLRYINKEANSPSQPTLRNLKFGTVEKAVREVLLYIKQF